MIISQRLYPVAFGLRSYTILLISYGLTMALVSGIQEISLPIIVLKTALLALVGVLAPLVTGFISRNDLLQLTLKLKAFRERASAARPTPSITDRLV